MKKITFLCSFLAIATITFGQSEHSLELDSLLDRYHSVPDNGGNILGYFTSEEITTLKSYLSTSNDTGESRERSFQNALLYGSSFELSSLVSFLTNDATSLTIISNNSGSTDFESAGDIDPNDLNTGYVLTLNNGEFFQVDIGTGNYTFLGSIIPPNGEAWNGLEFDQTTGILYGISSNFSNQSTLSTIDIGGLTATPVGLTGASGMISIAIDQDGFMFGHDVVDDAMYSINKVTGVATFLADLDFDANFGQDLEWDQDSQTLFMSAFNGVTFQGEFRSVDRVTGETTFISLLGSNGDQIAWSAGQNASLGTDDNNAEDLLSLSSNPTTDIATLEGLTATYDLAITNSLGQIMLQTQVNPTKNQINIMDFKTGLYFINLTNLEGISKTLKLIKK